MAENNLKNDIKCTPKITMPSKDKTKKYHCRHLTDEEIERIKKNCFKFESGILEVYDSEQLKECLRSLIFKRHY